MKKIQTPLDRRVFRFGTAAADRWRRLPLLTSILLLGTTPAFAPFVEDTYPTRAANFRSTLKSVADARGLTPAQLEAIAQIVARWIRAGPCMEAEARGEQLDMDAIGIVVEADPNEIVGGAILEMIGALSRDSLGRRPNADLCRFARETADRPR